MFSKVTNVINVVIKYLSLFGLSFIWLNFYLRNFKLSLPLAIIISLIVGFLLRLLIKKHSTQNAIKTNEQKKINEISNQLLFCDEKERLHFFNSVLTKKIKNLTLQKNYIIKNGEKKILFMPFYDNFLLTENNILEIYNQAIKIKANTVYVFCVNYNNEALRLSKLLNECEIILLNENDTFKKLFLPLQAYPETKQIFKENKKLQAKEYLFLAFNKKQTRKYFFGAVIMVLFSLFTPLRIYYLIFASLFFVFAIFSRYNQPFNQPKTDIFD